MRGCGIGLRAWVSGASSPWSHASLYASFFHETCHLAWLISPCFPVAEAYLLVPGSDESMFHPLLTSSRARFCRRVLTLRAVEEQRARFCADSALSLFAMLPFGCLHQFLPPSVTPSLPPSLHPSIHPSIHPSMHPS